MADIIDLKEANYKGVILLARVMPTEIGRRVIAFTYPGSNKQAVEDQGQVPRSFSLSGVIPHENYYIARDALIAVLEDGEKGTLIHPTFGEVNNVRNGRATITERISELGRAEWTIPFFIDDSFGIPQESVFLPAQVHAASDDLNTSLLDDLASIYKVTSNFVGNVQDSFNQLLEFPNDVIDSVAKIGSSVISGINVFRGTISAFKNNIYTLIQYPSQLSEGVGGIFTAIENLFDAPGDLFDAYVGIFSFGDDDQEIKQDTAGRIERKRNRELVRATIKTMALSYAYVAAVQIEYSSEIELNETHQKLEDQYLSIRDNEVLSNDALLKLDAVRVSANGAFSEILLNTRKVITINTRQIPLVALVFDYYGSGELVETIAKLNDIPQRSFVSGDVQILTE